MSQDPYQNIRQAIDHLLNIKSTVKREKQTKQIQTRDLFVGVITSLQMMTTRSTLLFADLRLDFGTYEEPFYEVIDALFLMKFGREACELVNFYLWERENSDGTINYPLDENNNPITLDNAQDLWNLLLKVNPKIDE